MRNHLPAWLPAVLLLAAGCGGGSEPGGVVPSASPESRAAGSPSTSPGGGCAAVADRVREHVGRPEVRTVTVEGQCTTVVITTTLNDGAGQTADELCARAAEVAYSGDVDSVRVLSRSGTELAQGSPGVACLP